jgi:hypothetical protein
LVVFVIKTIVIVVITLIVCFVPIILSISTFAAMDASVVARISTFNGTSSLLIGRFTLAKDGTQWLLMILFCLIHFVQEQQLLSLVDRLHHTTHQDGYELRQDGTPSLQHFHRTLCISIVPRICQRQP